MKLTQLEEFQSAAYVLSLITGSNFALLQFGPASGPSSIVLPVVLAVGASAAMIAGYPILNCFELGILNIDDHGWMFRRMGAACAAINGAMIAQWLVNRTKGSPPRRTRWWSTISIAVGFALLATAIGAVATVVIAQLKGDCL